MVGVRAKARVRVRVRVPQCWAPHSLSIYLEVMGGNPAVLQCGPSLESLGASEIKSFAKLRSLGGGIPQGAQSALLVGFLGAILFPVLV